MKFIGNYSKFITPELLNILLSNDGDITPVYQPEKWSGREDYNKARIELENAGYPDRNYSFCQYTKDTDCLKNLNLEMPIPMLNANSFWWFIKLKPGEMQPMHFDPHVKLVNNCTRYTMPLQDYIPGHIFVYNNIILKDYKAGDLFQWEDPLIYHGTVNISYSDRITLQISSHE